jgi:hypothetical protein
MDKQFILMLVISCGALIGVSTGVLRRYVMLLWLTVVSALLIECVIYIQESTKLISTYQPPQYLFVNALSIFCIATALYLVIALIRSFLSPTAGPMTPHAMGLLNWIVFPFLGAVGTYLYLRKFRGKDGIAPVEAVNALNYQLTWAPVLIVLTYSISIFTESLGFNGGTALAILQITLMIFMFSVWLYLIFTNLYALVKVSRTGGYKYKFSYSFFKYQGTQPLPAAQVTAEPTNA